MSMEGNIYVGNNPHSKKGKELVQIFQHSS